jgi:AcrR family transcriptional regulator
MLNILMRMDGQATAQRRRRSLGADDWIDAAMAVLAEDGVAAVAVEPLAARLGATKGSFYHHFPNRDALIAAALERWERRDTTDVRERLRLIADPRARIHAVMTAAITGRDGGLRDAALLASGAHPLVGPVVRRASAERIRYLTEAYEELGLPSARARRRALLTSAAYVGLMELIRTGGTSVSDADLRAYADEALEALVPPPEATG